MSLKERVLENPLVFRLVQAPFTRKKFDSLARS